MIIYLNKAIKFLEHTNRNQVSSGFKEAVVRKILLFPHQLGLGYEDYPFPSWQVLVIYVYIGAHIVSKSCILPKGFAILRGCSLPSTFQLICKFWSVSTAPCICWELIKTPRTAAAFFCELGKVWFNTGKVSSFLFQSFCFSTSLSSWYFTPPC